MDGRREDEEAALPRRQESSEAGMGWEGPTTPPLFRDGWTEERCDACCDHDCVKLPMIVFRRQKKRRLQEIVLADLTQYE